LYWELGFSKEFRYFPPEHRRRQFSYGIGVHEAERRTGGGEIWLAAAEHEGTKIKTIFVDKAECGETTRKVGTSDINVTV
jgi:hypothetical protein